MKLSYLDEKIKKCCFEQKEAVRILGADSARKLRTRLSDLFAVSCVSELVAGRPHPYKGKDEKRYSLDLTGGMRILFIPTEEPPPSKEDGGIDWGKVKEVTIVFIGDNHD
jgi:proteic killer suppression protein